MKVDVDIEDRDLDDLVPDDDDIPAAMVMVMIRTPDGMGYNAAVQLHESVITPAALAEAAVSAVHGAARTHSPALGDHINQWLAVPPGMEIVAGGDQ